MTPKEKAESLVNGIMSSTKNAKLSDYSQIYSPTAKKIVLLMIDEILNAINPFGQFLGKDYWEEVKQEIEKL